MLKKKENQTNVINKFLNLTILLNWYFEHFFKSKSKIKYALVDIIRVIIILSEAKNIKYGDIDNKSTTDHITLTFDINK